MSNPAAVRPAARGTRTTIQTVALIMGIVFLLVGLMGFIPGVATEFRTSCSSPVTTRAPRSSGCSRICMLRKNIVEVLYGVAGLLAARTARSARLYLVVGGLISLLCFIYGLVVPHELSRGVRVAQLRRQRAAHRPRRGHDRRRNRALTQPGRCARQSARQVT